MFAITEPEFDSSLAMHENKRQGAGVLVGVLHAEMELLLYEVAELVLTVALLSIWRQK